MRVLLFIFSLLFFKLTFGQKRVNDNLFYFNDTLKDYSNKTLYSGDYTAYYPGNIKFKGKFIDGLKQDRFIYYRDPSMSGRFYGLVDSIVEYSNGILNGQKLIYFDDYSTDVLKKKLNYLNGKLNGLCYYWDNSSQLEKVVNYKNDSIIEEQKFETDTTISRIVITLKEFPNYVVDLDKLPDSLTLEVVGVVPDYSRNEYNYSLKTLSNFSIKSYTVVRHMKFQNYYTKKFSSSIFKSGNKKDDGDVSIINLILIDKNNIEYEIQRTDFTTQ